MLTVSHTSLQVPAVGGVSNLNKSLLILNKVAKCDLETPTVVVNSIRTTGGNITSRAKKISAWALQSTKSLFALKNIICTITVTSNPLTFFKILL